VNEPTQQAPQLDPPTLPYETPPIVGARVIETARGVDAEVKPHVAESAARPFTLLIIGVPFLGMLGMATVLSQVPTAWAAIVVPFLGLTVLASFAGGGVLFIALAVLSMGTQVLIDANRVRVCDRGSWLAIDREKLLGVRVRARGIGWVVRGGASLWRTAERTDVAQLELLVDGGTLVCMRDRPVEQCEWAKRFLIDRLGIVAAEDAPSDSPLAPPRPTTASASAGPKGRRSLLQLGLVLLVPAIVLLAVNGWQIVRGQQAWNWPKRIGTMTESYYLPKRRGVEWRIAYDVEVAGQRYSNTRYQYGWPDLPPDFAGKHPAGSAIEVRVDPDDPRNATIEAGAARTSWGLAVIGAVLLVLAIVVLFARPTPAADDLRTRFAHTPGVDDAIFGERFRWEVPAELKATGERDSRESRRRQRSELMFGVLFLVVTLGGLSTLIWPFFGTRAVLVFGGFTLGMAAIGAFGLAMAYLGDRLDKRTKTHPKRGIAIGEDHFAALGPRDPSWWHNYVQVTSKPDAENAGWHEMTLLRGGGSERTFLVPTSLSDAVESFIREKLPKEPPTPTRAPPRNLARALRHRQERRDRFAKSTAAWWLVELTLLYAFIGLAGQFVFRGLFANGLIRFTPQSVGWMTLFAIVGPGTACLLLRCLRRRVSGPDVIAAFAFNLVAVVGAVVYGVALAVF
jgi:hypothetical protein